MKQATLLRQYKPRGFDCVCGNLRMASRAMTLIYDAHLRPSGLRVNQLAVLWAVMAKEPATVKELARTIVADDTTLIRNLRLLEKQGLIDIVAGEDRRQRIVHLTDQGRDTVARALPLWEAAQASIFADLGQRQTEQFAKALLKVAVLGR